MSGPFVHHVRIYYEDTDMAGVVYYANYLRYLERARTEWLRAAGWDLLAIQRDFDAVFVVRRVEADYLASARLNDWLAVSCEPEEVGRARLSIRQRIERAGERLLEARVIAAFVGASDGRPKAMPPALRESLYRWNSVHNASKETLIDSPPHHLRERGQGEGVMKSLAYNPNPSPPANGKGS